MARIPAFPYAPGYICFVILTHFSQQPLRPGQGGTQWKPYSPSSLRKTNGKKKKIDRPSLETGGIWALDIILKLFGKK